MRLQSNCLKDDVFSGSPSFGGNLPAVSKKHFNPSDLWMCKMTMKKAVKITMRLLIFTGNQMKVLVVVVDKGKSIFFAASSLPFPINLLPPSTPFSEKEHHSGRFCHCNTKPSKYIIAHYQFLPI